MASSGILVLLVLVHVVVFANVANAQTNSNLTLGSSITVDDPTTHLLSPSGDFAFGFQPIGPGFLLSIWFENIPEKTIVWSANGDNLAPKGSKLQLSSDNGLFLEDPQGGKIWSVKQPGSIVAYASMLDTGNLILMNSDDNISWDTFSNPTDTILPTQILGQGSQLVARYSETNYSGGRFTLAMRDEGNLKLYTLSYPLNSLNTAYWETNTVDSGFELVFNQTGQVYVAARNGTILATIQPSAILTDKYYRRAVIEYDGVFRHYIYPKSPTSDAGMPKAWSTVSNPVPPNICLSITQNVGSGACGYNSYCTLGSDQRPICECPKGYVWLDPNDKTQGCKQDFVSQSCDKPKPKGDQFILQEMINTDWPLSDYEMYLDQNENWCRQACLFDCFCAVAIE